MSGTLVFVSHIEDLATSFKGGTAKYQMLVPVPNSSVTYYFFTDPNDECPAGYGTGLLGDGIITGYITDSNTGQPVPAGHGRAAAARLPVADPGTALHRDHARPGGGADRRYRGGRADSGIAPDPAGQWTGAVGVPRGGPEPAPAPDHGNRQRDHG